MDILTHAAIGLVAASPFVADRPELALGVAVGSVLPDLDAFCGAFNRRAFLRFHQTWTHALPVQLAFSFGAGIIAGLLGWNGIELGGGLLAGLCGHSLLDLTNTFGVAWWTPFSRRRLCLEWVFFIDSVVLAAVAVALAGVVPGLFRGESVAGRYAVAFLAFLCAYVLGKGALRRRAARFAPQSNSLVPSALVPWRFFRTERKADAIGLWRVNALTGAQSLVAQVPVLDETFVDKLETVPEFLLMRTVSCEYHVVGVQADGPGTRLLCRDMRMRNFGTRFGDLEVWLDAEGHVTRKQFHV